MSEQLGFEGFGSTLVAPVMIPVFDGDPRDGGNLLGFAETMRDAEVTAGTTRGKVPGIRAPRRPVRLVQIAPSVIDPDGYDGPAWVAR